MTQTSKSTSASSRNELLPFQIVTGISAGSIGGIVAVLGELRDEFDFSTTGIGIIVAAGFLAAFIAQMTLARYADQGYGRRMATIGIAISAISLLAMVFADDLVTWSLSRGALGFAGGLIMPGIRRAATVLDPQKVGENLGRLIVGEILGFICGPAISAALVEVGGIRAPFLAFAIGLVMFLPFVMRLPPDKGKLDRSGRKSSFDLLRLRRLQGALLLILGYFVLIGAFESIMPVMFQDRGGGARETSIAFTVLAIPIAMSSTRAGRTADRIGPSRVAVAGMTVVGLASVLAGFLPGILLPTLLMAVIGVAHGYGFTASQVAVSRSVPEERQAGALGLMGATEVLAAGAAAIPAAMLYDTTGARAAWAATGGSMLLIVALGWYRLRGTEPANPSGAAMNGTPVDCHSNPAD